MVFKGLHGFPAANTLSGISFVTTLPAPITLFICTPPRISTLDVIHTLSSIVIYFAITLLKSLISFVDVITRLLKENPVFFPIYTGA